MNLAVAMPNITRTDIWLVIGLASLLTLAIKACRGFKLPDPDAVQRYATVSNTPGGIILILLFLWIGTLILIVGFCVWVIMRGIDPQNAVVIFLTGVLGGTAFGNVNGAMFTAMKGLEPHPPITNISTATTASSAVPPVAPIPPASETEAR